MIEKKDLLISYLSWIVCFLLCMLVGIYKTYALTFTNFQYIQNNTNLLVGYANSAQPISWPYNNSGLYQENITILDYVISNVSISANVHYEFESHMLSQRIIGSPTYTVTGLNGESCLTDSYYLNFINSEYPRWDFQCPHASDTFTIHIYQPNNSKLFNSGTMGWGSAILSQTNESISSTNNDTEEIINNQNKNANDIIDNQNQNTENIINNQDKNTQEILENDLTCYNGRHDLKSRLKGKYIQDSSGNIANNSAFSVSQYFYIEPNKNYTIDFNNITSLQYGYICWYKDNTKLSCTQYQNMSGYGATNFTVTSPANANRVTITFRNNSNATIRGGNNKLCENKNDELNNSINDLNNNLNDDDSSGATNEADDFFSNFSTNTFGLTSIITSPLILIQSIASQSCSSLHLPLPYLNNKYLDLPCMSTIYSTYFGTFFTLYQTITYGIIAYWVCVRIFNQVKDFKNPEHDEIEVLDL